MPLSLALVAGGIVLGVGVGAAAQSEEAAVPRETRACLDCHDGKEATLAGGPHMVLLPGEEGDETRLSCTSCHLGTSLHWEDDPESYPMFKPSSEAFAKTTEVCGQCHQNVHQVNQATLSPHANARVGCVECHSVHGAQGTGLLAKEQPGLCFDCHGDVRGQFAKPAHHPVEEGIMDCVDCHLMRDDEMAQLERHGKNAACVKCHNEFQGPFPFDHQAAVDYSTEEGGCINCHDPHGSYLPRMLTQPYEAPHFQLCTQCHVIPRHNFNSQHGSNWAGISCSECHADIHGSYTSHRFFAPTLAAQGCFAVGCHSQ